MATTDILTAFVIRLNGLGSLPIAWPGIPKTPPSTGMWLEALFFPNEPTDMVWGNNSYQDTLGFFQVSVFWRPNEDSLIEASEVADTVIAFFEKGQAAGSVKVRKTPYQGPAVDLQGKSFIPVTIPYRGILPVTGFSGELVVGGRATSDIVGDLLSRLDTLSALPVAWPGVHKEPPSTGMWIETRFAPNEPEDLVWDNDTQKNTSGTLLVRVYYRPGTNTGQNSQLAASVIADTVIDHFKKGFGVGAVQISKAPWQGPAVNLVGESYIPVMVPYKGIVAVPTAFSSYVVNGGVNVVNNGTQVVNT